MTISTASDWVSCCTCGVLFGMSNKHVEQLRLTGKNFFCPNGHTQTFGEGEADKLRRERDRLKQQIAQRDDAVKAAEQRVQQAEKTASRLQKRAKAGVCPCCNRTVSQLARHMQSKHPDFDPTNVVSIQSKTG